MERGSQVGFVSPALPLQGLFLIEFHPGSLEQVTPGFHTFLCGRARGIFSGATPPFFVRSDTEDGCKSG